MWDEITDPFPNSNGELVKFGNEYVSLHILLWMLSLIHAMI